MKEREMKEEVSVMKKGEKQQDCKNMGGAEDVTAWTGKGVKEKSCSGLLYDSQISCNIRLNMLPLYFTANI